MTQSQALVGTTVGVMITRDIRAFLRAATAARILSGWNFYELRPGERRWTYSPMGGDSCDVDEPGVIAYCGMLAAAGVQPRYVGD
jgi:hypothetical protein